MESNGLASIVPRRLTSVAPHTKKIDMITPNTLESHSAKNPVSVRSATSVARHKSTDLYTF